MEVGLRLTITRRGRGRIAAPGARLQSHLQCGELRLVHLA